MSTRKRASAISRSGKRGMKKMVTSAGRVLGAAADPAGTLSAARWQLSCWAPKSIFIVAGVVKKFLPQKEKMRKPEVSPARQLFASCLTTHTLWFWGRKKEKR